MSDAPTKISSEDNLALENAVLRRQLAEAKFEALVERLRAKYSMTERDMIKPDGEIIRAPVLQSVPPSE